MHESENSEQRNVDVRVNSAQAHQKDNERSEQIACPGDRIESSI